MSKPMKIRRQVVVRRPSRIRRDPVPIEKPKVRVRSPELEMWGGVTGIVLFASALAIVIVGVSIATYSRTDPRAEAAAAAKAQRFAQCYEADGPNCVLDGQTIYAAGQKIEIAGIDAPRIQNASCATEREHGIDAAIRLADLLNKGPVTAGRPFRDEYGRMVRKVAVDGDDVGETMTREGRVRESDGTRPDWCAAPTPASDAG